MHTPVPRPNSVMKSEASTWAWLGAKDSKSEASLHASSDAKHAEYSQDPPFSPLGPSQHILSLLQPQQLLCPLHRPWNVLSRASPLLPLAASS